MEQQRGMLTNVSTRQRFLDLVWGRQRKCMHTSRGRAQNAAREERGAWARGRARKAPMGEPGQARAQKSMGWLGLLVAVRHRLVARLQSTLRW